MKKSLRVKGLDPEAEFGTMARLILRDRLRRVTRVSKRYLADHDPEDLKSIRTALQRLRYPLECFVDCLPRRLFNATLDQIALLQRAIEQVTYGEAVLDELRSHRHGDESAPLPIPAPTSDAGAAVITLTRLQAKINHLDEEHQQRREAIEGAMKTILESDELRRFRQALES